MELFVAHFVVQEQNLWFAPGIPQTVARKTENYRLLSQLFAAADAEAAYAKASQMVGGLSDAHFDGPGDRTEIQCIGIYELEEVVLSGHSLIESVHEPYGLDVGCVGWQGSAPQVRSKNELSLFSPHGT